jgi:predicted TIM-barrel fold metal-dependent hydrolase
MSLVIDSHTHIGVRHGASQSAEELIGKLDQAGVDKAVMFPFPEGNGLTGDVRENNSVVTAAMAAHPDRVIPFCIVNPWHKEAAVEELRHCVEDLGFKGVKIHPTLHGYRLADHELVDPIFAAARDLGIVITCHGAGDLLNNPAEFAEMAGTFPTVPLLMVHMGVFWSTDHAVVASKAHPNLYLDTSRAPIWEIQVAVKALGPEKVIWGTDAPFVDYDAEFEKMARATDDRSGYELIVGGNIARLLHLES